MAITSLSEFSINQFLPKRNNLRSSYIGSITFIASTKLSSSSSAPPSGTQTGDFVLVIGVRDDDSASVPNGFTTLFNESPYSTNYAISYKIWGAGDSSISTSMLGDLDYVYAAYTFRNVQAVSPTPATPTFTDTGQNQVSFPAITTSTANSMVLRIAMIDEGSITSVDYPSPWITTPVYVTGPTGSGDNRVSIALAYYEVTEPTTVSAATYAFIPTLSAGDNNGATIALTPVGA